MATAAPSLSALKSHQSSTNRSANDARFNAEALTWDSNPFVNAASQHAFDFLTKHFSPHLNETDPQWTNLELGCGTGLLSLKMAPVCKVVVAVDAAEGMINVLRKKVEGADLKDRIIPVAVLLEDPEDPALPATSFFPFSVATSDPNPAASANGDPSTHETGSPRLKYDLVTSQLVLHHIPTEPLRSLLHTMYALLRPNGASWVALTDFEHTGPRSRRFHPRAKMDGVERDGVEPREMEGWLREAGFVDVRVVSGAWVMDKRVELWEGEFEGVGRDGEKGEIREKEEMGEIQHFPFVCCLGRRPADGEKDT